jgi:hypothetical protein
MLVNDATAVRVTGDATGVLVRGNNVTGRASTTENFLLRMEDCAGASPWVVQNYGLELKNLLAGTAGPDAPATIRAAGDCHPVIEANRVIHGFAQDDAVTVVECTSANNVASRCVLTNNPDVSGGYAVYNTSINSAASAVAVDCDFGCSRVDHNRITGFQAYTGSCSAAHCSRSALGLRLNGGTTWVSSNRIVGGSLGWLFATGVSMADPNGRLDNNVIFGTDGAPASRDAVAGSGLGQARLGVGLASYSGDVHSNFIAGSDGALVTTNVHACASDGVDLSGGTLRNNIITGGVCGVSIVRLSSAAVPTTFEHNALYDGAVTVSDNDNVASGALLGDYTSSGIATGTMLFTAADVDAKLGGNGSFAERCDQTSDRHLAAGSACIDAGTPAGAPELDLDGDARDASPDVGPDEYRP